MRLPNGLGSVVKLTDRPRRKPWAAKKTVGYKENGQQIQKYLGYYATKKEAIEALGSFAALPYDLTKDKLTVDMIFLKAIERESFAENTIYGYKSVYNKYFESVRNIPYKDLTLEKAQNIIDKIPTGNQGNARSVFLMMEKFAVENGYTVKTFASFIRKHKHEIVSDKIPFTNTEIQMLWQHEGEEGADILLLYLYTGFRLMELLTLKKEAVHLDAEIPYFQGGMKTKAGKDRIVPIHSKILHLVQKFMAIEGEFFIPDYRNASLLRKPVNRIMTKLALKHCIHECRHTFRSELDRRDGNQVCIDKILGHATSGGVGEKVYTHKLITELKQTVELVKYED